MKSSRVLVALLVTGALGLFTGCGDDGGGTGGTGSPCTSSAECNAGLSCIDSTCQSGGDAGGDTGLPDTGTADTAPSCPSADRCGSDCCEATEECVANACMPICESSLRCGPASTCCAAGDLCISDACTTPGDTCADPIDCGADEYCDSSIGRCLPRLAGRCEYFPPGGAITPAQQWHWSGSTTEPSYVHVMMTPVVGDLDGDAIPEVLFNTYQAATSYGGRGVLRAVRGDDGTDVFSVSTPEICGDSGIALGDLDGDGSPEIVTTGPCSGTGRVHVFDSTGTHLWSATNPDGTPHYFNLDFGAPSIADLEGDGQAEVIVGGTVYESNGTLRFANRNTAFGCCSPTAPRSQVTVAYNVDDDPELEIVGSNVVWNSDGSVLWDNPGAPEGFIAVADFFADGQPDLVVVHEGSLSIFDASDGTPLWGPIVQPGGGRGGPPTIADFDGDDLPEIGVAGAASYSVYDPDGSTPILWSQTTQDMSSNITGSSVFDFDGDGSAEVVYNDECYMRVYAGADGTVLAEVPQHSHTLIEYPLIVDVDGDGNTEIVFAGNAVVARCAAIPGYTGNLAGIRVFEDAADNWVGTRRVWNQHAYSISHIREDLSVPMSVERNSDRWNSFRQNPQSFDAPDLVGAEATSDGTACPIELRLSARIQNDGAAAVGPGLSVSFYLGTPAAPGRLLGTVMTTGLLVPGAAETVTLAFEPTVAEQTGAPLDFFFVADDIGDGTGEHNECIEDNNSAVGTFTCPGIS
ncbi:MAG: hypothetical protein DRJ42_05785 [Deltaproteobacteria bacterium]|nr:MAG: hypothetical protein DRJ42_05785 [Deltaproteobacteria bacterium]